MCCCDERERGASEERFSVTRFSVARINYRRKGASWRGRRGRDVTSDARFLSRIGRRLFLFLSPSLSLRLEGFFLLEIGRSCSKRGLKNIPPPENSRFVRASTLNVLVAVPVARKSASFSFFLLSHFHEEQLETNYSSARINSPVLIRTPIQSSRPLFHRPFLFSEGGLLDLVIDRFLEESSNRFKDSLKGSR